MTTTTPRYTATILVLILLFIGTGFLARAYRTERQARAEHQFAVGQQLNRAGRKNVALAHYRTALQIEPGNPRYELALALVLVDLGHLGEAESHLQELLQQDPTNGLLNLTMARVAAREGRVDSAVTYYHRAIYGLWPEKPNTNRIDTRLELIAYLAKTGSRQQRIAELVQLRSELPVDPALKQRVAGLFMAAGSPQDAAGLYRELTQAKPSNPEAWAGLGEAEFELADYQAAQAAFRRAATYHAKDPNLAVRLAWVNEYLSLDPTWDRLAAIERARRIRRLVGLTLAALNSCLDRHDAAIPDAVQTLANQAGTLLDSRRRVRNPVQAADGELSLTEQLWRAKQSLCPEPAGADTPLAALLDRLTRPPLERAQSRTH